MTKYEDNPYVMTIEQAGKEYFGIGRSASYAAAKRGEIPTIRVGRKLLVSRNAMRKIVGVGEE